MGCRICEGEGCLNCEPNPDNICTDCGNPDCENPENCIKELNDFLNARYGWEN